MLTLNKPSLIRSLLSSLALVLVADYSAAQTCVQPPPGIIAWWPLDETSGTTASDRAGNHTGAYANAPLPAQGKVRSALRFNGTNYVAAADSDPWAFGAGDFTVELWANFDAPGSGDIVHAGDIFIGNDEGPGSVNKWFFALGGGVLHFTVYNTLNPPPNFFLVRAPFSPVVGQWYHLAVTKNGILFTIYVNGLEVGSEISVSPIANPNAPLTIGQAENLGFMNGRLDEVTVYNRALSPQELGAIVDASSAGKCINLSIRPDKGGDTGSVSVHINGTGFAQSATVKLVRAGEPDILGDGAATVGADSSTIDTTFDLLGKTRGAWDVVVEDSGNISFILAEGFTIEEGSAPRLSVDIVGLPVIRTGVWQDYWIAYGTTGNVDVAVSKLFIALPRGLEYTLDLPVFQGPNPPAVREFGGSVDTSLLYIALPNLAPSSSQAIKISLKAPATLSAPISIKAFAYPSKLLGPLAPAPPPSLQPGRITHIAFRFPLHKPGQRDDGHLGFVTTDDTVIQWELTANGDEITESPYNPKELPVLIQIPELTDVQARELYDWAKAQVDTGYTYSRDPQGVKDIEHKTGACDGFIERGLEKVKYRNGEGLVDNWWENLAVFASNLSPQELYGQLRSLTGDKRLPPWQGLTWLEVLELSLQMLLDFMSHPILLAEGSESDKVLSTIGSWDPNDKVGPNGNGTERFVMGSKPLQYSVFFENLETASAPAQEVVITDQLDKVNMDLSTFSLGPMAFGGKIVAPPPGQSAFATSVDLRPGNDLIVRVSGSLNPNTGLLTWRLTSIDPATGNLPTDPRVGFLPPNLVPPEGDGSVLFTIMPKKDLVTGTEITNQASIVFDANAPILTPSWLNTLDNSKPTSQVSFLPATQSSTSFEVQWSGTDEGAGIRDFTIYVSDNGGPFDVALAQTTQTSATYTGVAGHTYAFYSLARDLTGNLEDAKTVAEASTIVVLGDVTPPDLTLPFNITMEATGAAGAVISYTASGVDVVDGMVPVVCNPISGSTFPIAATTVNCSTIDQAGNAANGSFVVTVRDTTPPILTLPSNIAVGAIAATGAPVTYIATATDLVDGSVPVTCLPTSGSIFPMGTTGVNCSSTDQRLNTRTGTFTVTVLNNAPIAQPDTANTLEAVPVDIAVLTNDSDIDGGVLTVASASAPAHGTTTVGAGGVITYTPADGYFGADTFTYTLSDSQGGTSPGTVTVAVSRLGRFVALGAEQVWLRSKSKVVTGDVGANVSLAGPPHRRERDEDGEEDHTVEVRIGQQATMLQPGSRVVGDTVWLRARSSVFNVVHNELINRKGSILGMTSSPVTLPFVPLPNLPIVQPGTQDVVVARDGTMTLPPGSYGHVQIRQRGTLILTGGLYQVLTLDLDQQATVLVRGASEVRVKGELDTDARARIIVDSGLKASSVLMYIEGDDTSCNHDRHGEEGDDAGPTAVHIGAQNIIQANIFAPNGTLWLKARSTASGAFIGKRVRIGEQVQLTLDSAFK